MAEISENLHRRDLTALERNELQDRWIEIVEARRKKTLPGEVRPAMKDGRKKGPQHMPSGINQAARELGVPATNLKQARRIAKLKPEAKEAAKAFGLADNQSALLAAAKEKTPERQVEALLKGPVA